MRKSHLAAVDGHPATCLARLLGVFQVASRVPVGAEGGEGSGEGGGWGGGSGSGRGLHSSTFQLNVSRSCHKIHSQHP